MSLPNHLNGAAGAGSPGLLGVDPAPLRTVASVAATPAPCVPASLVGSSAAGMEARLLPHLRRLADVGRGLWSERSRQLRCARCGGGWRTSWLRCAYCDNTHHTTLGSLIADVRTETRKLETGEACRSYLNSITTLRATPPRRWCRSTSTPSSSTSSRSSTATRGRRGPASRLRARVIEASSCPPPGASPARPPERHRRPCSHIEPIRTACDRQETRLVRSVAVD